MRQFAKSLVKFVKAEDGPTAVEYAVMLALIIVVCITAITTLGTKANATFEGVGSALPAGRAAPTPSNVLLALLPRVVIAVMHTTMIRANMTAYSTAVGPSSALTNFTTLLAN